VQDRAAPLHAPVVAASDDAAVMHEHGSDRNAAFVESPLRFSDRGREKFVHGQL
jgi:hypothetical protein